MVVNGHVQTSIEAQSISQYPVIFNRLVEFLSSYFHHISILSTQHRQQIACTNLYVPVMTKSRSLIPRLLVIVYLCVN